jgi:hypothetical protein
MPTSECAIGMWTFLASVLKSCRARTELGSSHVRRESTDRKPRSFQRDLIPRTAQWSVLRDSHFEIGPSWPSSTAGAVDQRGRVTARSRWSMRLAHRPGRRPRTGGSRRRVAPGHCRPPPPSAGYRPAPSRRGPRRPPRRLPPPTVGPEELFDRADDLEPVRLVAGADARGDVTTPAGTDSPARPRARLAAGAKRRDRHGRRPRRESGETGRTASIR